MKKLLSSVALLVGIASTAIAPPAQADVIVGGTVRLGNTDVFLQYGSTSPYRIYNYPTYSPDPYTIYYRRDPYTYHSYPIYNYPARVYAPRVYVVPAPTYVVPRYSVPGYYRRSDRNYYKHGGYYW